jgi:predicted nucleotidyltransferase
MSLANQSTKTANALPVTPTPAAAATQRPSSHPMPLASADAGLAADNRNLILQETALKRGDLHFRNALSQPWSAQSDFTFWKKAALHYTKGLQLANESKQHAACFLNRLQWVEEVSLTHLYWSHLKQITSNAQRDQKRLLDLAEDELKTWQKESKNCFQETSLEKDQAVIKQFTPLLTQLQVLENIAHFHFALAKFHQLPPVNFSLDKFAHYWKLLSPWLYTLQGVASWVDEAYEYLSHLLESYLEKLNAVLGQANANDILNKAQPLLADWRAHKQEGLIARHPAIFAAAKDITAPASMPAPSATAMMLAAKVDARRQSLFNNRQQLKADWQQAKTTETKLLAQRTYTQATRNLVEHILRDIDEWLGTAPCGFAVIGFGSIAREDFSPTSDIDLAILVDRADARSHFYFQNLLNALRLIFSCLGNSDTVDPITHDVGHLQLDSKDISYLSEKGEFKFLNTPQQLIADLYPDDLYSGR